MPMRVERIIWIDRRKTGPSAHILTNTVFYYLDAVEEALRFGRIDSMHAVIDGVRMQKFFSRKKNSPWTELNKERVRRLEKLGLMTEGGRAVLPAMGTRGFKVDPDIEAALKQARAWSKFKSFPVLYQRVQAGNIALYKKRDPAMYEQTLSHLIVETKKGRMFGEWNDYGRLLKYWPIAQLLAHGEQVSRWAFFFSSNASTMHPFAPTMHIQNRTED